MNKNKIIIEAVEKVSKGENIGNVGKIEKIGIVKKSPNSIPMTEQQVEDLTASCIAKLNEHTDKATLIWIEAGKLVSDYVASFSGKGISNESLFQKLAGHPTSKIQAQQIRYYYSSYMLFKTLGEDAPGLQLTHYISVLPKSVPYGKKLKLLQEAADKELSVSQLKVRVKEESPSPKTSISKNEQATKPEPINWDSIINKVNYQSKTLLMTLMSIMRENDGNEGSQTIQADKTDIAIPNKVKKTIKSALKSINDFVIAHNLIPETVDSDAPATRKPTFIAMPIMKDMKNAA